MNDIPRRWLYTNPIFHWHYLYDLFDIQLKFTPQYMIHSPTRFELISKGLKF